MTNDLTLIVEKMDLAPEQSKTLISEFGNLFVDAHKLVAQSKAIVVTREDQTEEMAKAKKLRVQLMRVRTDAEKVKKAIKEPYLRGAQASQDIFNDIKRITKPEEERLKEQEKFAEIAEAKRVEARHVKRVEKLSKYVDDVSVYSLRDMTDEVFETLVVDNKKVHDAKIEAERLAEEARLAEIKAEEERQVKIEAENVRLKEEAKVKAEAEADRLKAEVVAKRIKKEAEEKAENLRIEKETKIKAENDAKIRVANKAKEEAEKKLRDTKNLQKKRQLEENKRYEAKKRLEEDEAKKKLLAPDREKLAELVRVIDTIKFPAVSSSEAGEIIREANLMLDNVSKFIREKAKGL